MINSSITIIIITIITIVTVRDYDQPQPNSAEIALARNRTSLTRRSEPEEPNCARPDEEALAAPPYGQSAE